MNDKRLIEDFLPIREISKESAREKIHKAGAYINFAFVVGS